MNKSNGELQHASRPKTVGISGKSGANRPPHETQGMEFDPTVAGMLNRTSKRSKSGEGASDRGARVRYRGPDTAAVAIAVRTLEKGEKERP